VVDGDTLIIDLNNNGKYDKTPVNESCRLIGVFATELNKIKAKLPESGSIDSTHFLNGLVASSDNKVNIAYDKTLKDTDNFNRELIYVYLPNGTSINEAIIKSGYSIVYLKYSFDAMKKEKYIQLTNQAYKNKAGLWNDKVIKAYWLDELRKYGVNLNEVR
jgi:endonuclease YncB( thermonuclease family)